ncbi:MAG TPA: metallophosphoesterase [Candidatus Acidoferrales bacterium]|jgi:hypothetical protein|nr:metallophosphoesterase [Candidatus Acidoferrales bacterium]
MRKRIVTFLVVVQSILFASHWFVYQTWTWFRHAPDPPGISWLAIGVAVLSITFLTASLLSRKYSQLPVRVYYTAAAVWLGFFSFFFLAACASWIVYAAARLLHLGWPQPYIALALFGAAIVAGLYGIVNSLRTRITRVSVKLPNLPTSWIGRVAALVTDTHLGHVRGRGFAQRIVRMLSQLDPDMVLIAGDMYDGTAVNAGKLAAPWHEVAAPLGTYFIAGNHEEFGDYSKYLSAVQHSGVRVLNNEKVLVDGLQLVGVHHHDSVQPEHFRGVLRRAGLDPEVASVLLTHAPHHLPVAAEEKISLQLSGHTHGGQFFPFTWITSRIYGPFVYGLQRLGDLLVYTSCGAGTWGPPMRLGTNPEIVLITFE